MSSSKKRPKPCPRGHHHFSQGWEMGVRRIGQRCDCGQMEIAQTSAGGIIERIQPPSPPAGEKQYMPRQKIEKCSFCNASQHDTKMIVKADRANICLKCIFVCLDVVADAVDSTVMLGRNHYRLTYNQISPPADRNE